MRPLVTGEKIERLMFALGQSVRGPGTIFFTGGVTALLHGWRDTTIDIDLKALPEPSGLYEALAQLKERESVNIELASPDDFIPELPGWRERSLFIARHGQIDFYHYDPYAQALAKIERGHTRDLADAESMIAVGLVDRAKLLELFAEIEPSLIRYPAVEARVFRRKVERFVAL
ncbi:MAG: hypothetical protein EBV06_17580 [Planctomycetia bacterium]|nr:hypothetical protein [Planctomycetia bacterium]